MVIGALEPHTAGAYCAEAREPSLEISWNKAKRHPRQRARKKSIAIAMNLSADWTRVETNDTPLTKCERTSTSLVDLMFPKAAIVIPGYLMELTELKPIRHRAPQTERPTTCAGAHVVNG